MDGPTSRNSFHIPIDLLLELVDLTRRFGDQTAVSRASVKIGDGEMVGIIGKSGAGKSTLLRLINRLIEPSEGRILFDGIDVTDLRGLRLSERIQINAWDQVAYVIVLILISVAVIDTVSRCLRLRLIGVAAR
jgi:ABC-type methionine transport system ATPase subunit